MGFSSGPSSGDCPWQATNFVTSQLSTREEKTALCVGRSGRIWGGSEGAGGEEFIDQLELTLLYRKLATELQ